MMCGLAREYLKRLSGYCSASPGQCSMITCEFNCALYLCNQVRLPRGRRTLAPRLTRRQKGAEVQVPCTQLVEDMDRIEDGCANIMGDGPLWIKGQAKHAAAQGWRTVIEQSRCGRDDVDPLVRLTEEARDDPKRAKEMGHDEL